MPVRMAAGWSRDDRAAMSIGIRYFTRPGWAPWPIAAWSHMFVVFEFADGRQVIHEALLSEGWCAKDGQKLPLWIAKDQARHHAVLHWLPFDADTVEAIYRRSCGWLGTRSYAVRQIGAFALANSILGRSLGLAIRSGPDELICSEGASMLIGMASPKWDLREITGESWDSISPQMAYDVIYNILRPALPAPAPISLPRGC